MDQSRFSNVLSTIIDLYRKLRQRSYILQVVSLVPYLIPFILILGGVSYVLRFLDWMIAQPNPAFGVWAVVAFSIALVEFAGQTYNEAVLNNFGAKSLDKLNIGHRKQILIRAVFLATTFAFFAVFVFGGLPCVLQRANIVKIEPVISHTDSCTPCYADLYLWHLFDAIPGIKFTSTLGWETPYQYSDSISPTLVFFLRFS